MVRQDAASEGTKSHVSNFSSCVPTPERRRTPCVHVAAMNTLTTDVDQVVAAPRDRQPKGDAKHRSPVMSKAMYVSYVHNSQ